MKPIDENKVVLKYQSTLAKSAFGRQIGVIIDSLSSPCIKVTLVIEKV